MAEVIFHVLVLAVMLLFFKESFDITSGRIADPIGPAGFPQAILVIIVVLLVISLIGSVKRLKETRATGEPININTAFIGILLSVAGFVILSDIIGFSLTTILFCMTLFILLGKRSYGKMALQAIIVSVAFTFVFGKILTIPLPRGMGIIKELSFFLY